MLILQSLANHLFSCVSQSHRYCRKVLCISQEVGPLKNCTKDLQCTINPANDECIAVLLLRKKRNKSKLTNVPVNQNPETVIITITVTTIHALEGKARGNLGIFCD